MMKLAGIRFRITAVASLVVALVLIAAGAALVVLQRNALLTSIDQNLTQRADDIEVLLREDDRPGEFAAGPGEGFVQLVDADGAILASSGNIAEDPALSLGFSQSGDTIRNADGLPADDDTFRVLSRPLAGGVLHVATTVDTVEESTTALVGALALTIPAVVVILGGVVWWLVGRTLRPVESIRSEVAVIGSTELDRRVPRPETDDEIDRLAATMNEMLERLESAAERQQRFVADASHELRSPLTRLRGELELDIAASEDEEEARLRSLLNEVIAMQDMVDDLLYLAQADAGAIDRDRVPLDLDDLVLREGARVQANGRVDVDLSKVSGAHVVGDRSQLGRAVKNLFGNAERHAAHRVIVALDEHDGSAVLAVHDDGPGIPSPEAERIFERFGRLDQARSTDTGGTGLGLAIAREIVDRHGGTLRLANPGEPGATFEMRLPVVGCPRGQLRSACGRGRAGIVSEARREKGRSR